jgi:broad specificity phosphatase PhoE
MAWGGPPAGSVVLVRHGATEWSQSGRHTSRTDLPLLPAGRQRAQDLRSVLDPSAFGRVLCSPLLRATETCELAGFRDRAEIVEDLHEWDYGDYEGLTTPQIREQRPDWILWRDGCPAGESPEAIRARADQVLESVRRSEADRPVILFAHGHILRVIAARWIGLDVTGGRILHLSAGSLSVLGHEHALQVIRAWNALVPA